MGWLRSFTKELTGKDLGDPKIAADELRDSCRKAHEFVDGLVAVLAVVGYVFVGAIAVFLLIYYLFFD